MKTSELKELIERATKGKWEQSKKHPCRVFASGQTIYATHPENEGTEREEEKANAALIALTPSLAAEVIALRELLVRFSGCSTCRYGNTEKKRPAICDACVKEGAGMYYLWELDPALTDSEQIDETMKRR
jgi:hypothetical protein